MDKNSANFQPWEKAFDEISTPFEDFIHDETAAGVILIVCTVIALFLANGFLHHHYEHLLHTELAISLGGYELRGSMETSGKFNFSTVMFEGDSIFLPLYNAELTAILFPRIQVESPAMLFNRKMVDVMGLMPRREIPEEPAPEA